MGCAAEWAGGRFREHLHCGGPHLLRLDSATHAWLGKGATTYYPPWTKHAPQNGLEGVSGNTFAAVGSTSLTILQPLTRG
jgi:hypothetical protein